MQFTVRDDGAGIPEAYHDIIFRKFGTAQQTEGSPSTGLGLTFCKLAIEAHGGRIWVESGGPRGAAFHFVVPRGAAHLPPAGAV